MLVRPGLNSDPREKHDTVSHHAEVVEEGRAAVLVLDFLSGLDGIANRLDGLLEVGRGHVELLGLGGGVEELARLDKTLEDARGLV